MQTTTQTDRASALEVLKQERIKKLVKAKCFLLPWLLKEFS